VWVSGRCVARSRPAGGAPKASAVLRLKELEALEKLVEKVGRIDLHAGAGGGGFDALLQNLYKLSRDKDEVKS
jgi:hypothetical protein